MPFTKLGLPESLVRNVLKLGYESPTPIQARGIPAVLTGRDLVGIAQTGTGKTAAFLLPVLSSLLERSRGTTGALVLTPTRELAGQIELVFRGLAAGTGLRCALVVGGSPPIPQERALRAGADLVVATPGRLLDHMSRGVVDMTGLRALVLDEADQMFDMGFLPDLRRIVGQLPTSRQTLLFSATMPPEVARLSRTITRDPETIEVSAPGTTAKSVTQTIYPVPAHRKSALLLHLLEQWEMPSVLVFTRTKHGAKKLANTIYDAGHGVAELHGNRSPTQRARAMDAFRNKKAPIMVATNIAARGLDLRHITHVVNYDVPNAPEDYVHRIGRTGRAGDTGDALVLLSPEEQSLLARIERQIGERLPRLHVEDFDYQSPKPPTPSKKGPAHGKTKVFVGSKKKPYRGQGRR